KQHHVFTLATSHNDEPYCCSCFYAYSKEKNIFIFTSEKTTKHVSDIEMQSRVAGNIHLETKIIGKIRGIQFTGTVHEAINEDLSYCKMKYLLRFPYAILNTSTIWYIKPNFIKLTDNRLGFGKKIIWKEPDDNHNL
ncbi:MAG: hypothetical protein Q8880_06955, partial [Bacteroidota bacterium]|nr:hypothetical protein [Bacteroidota bacterium]